MRTRVAIKRDIQTTLINRFRASKNKIVPARRRCSI